MYSFDLSKADALAKYSTLILIRPRALTSPYTQGLVVINTIIDFSQSDHDQAAHLESNIFARLRVLLDHA